MFTHVQLTKNSNKRVNSSRRKEDNEENCDFGKTLKKNDNSQQRSHQIQEVVDSNFNMSECDSTQLMDEEDLKLICSEVVENVKTKTEAQHVPVGDEGSIVDGVNGDRNYQFRGAVNNEQVLDERVEQRQMPKLGSTLFDNAPGFAYVKKSPKVKRNMPSNPKPKPVETKHVDNKKLHETEVNDVIADKSAVISWVKFEENEDNGEKLHASYSSSKQQLSINKHSECTAVDGQFLRESSVEETSLTSTPAKQINWVSFENDAITKQLPVGKGAVTESKDGQHPDELDYENRISSNIALPYLNTPSAMLSRSFISDVYDIPDDISEPKKEVSLVSINNDYQDRGKDISSDLTIHDDRVLGKKDEVLDDFETDSNFSGEICDLNNLENDSLLRDTRKPFPKEGIFQASSAKPKCNQETNVRTPSSGKKVVVKEVSFDENNTAPLHDYPAVSTKTEWMFMYRYPDKKKKLGSRRWLPVKVEVKDDAIKIIGHLGNVEILKEMPLHQFFVFTMPVLHQGEGQEKLHSVKLQYVKYKETRKLASKFHLEHMPFYTPVLKLASRDHKALKEFVDTVENVVRKIETHRDKGITHRHEEIFIDCDDMCQYELDGHGKVKRYNITCQIRLRAFITGIPNLYLFLNDITAYNKQKSRRTDGKQPKSNKWIRLESTEYHPSVQVAATETEGGVVFKPPDACSFELMRFRARNTRDVPMVFKAAIDFTTTKSFQMKAECKISGDGKMMKYRRSNIVVRFPIPATWTSVFVKSRSFAGHKKYAQARADQKTFASGMARTLRCYMEISTGVAKYEPEYCAVVWRIGDLPILASGVPADAVQTFDLQVNLPFEIDLPRTHEFYAEVEYEIPHAVGSEIQIQEVLLSDGRTPDKWVCYRALYSYKVLMNVTNMHRLGDL
eukprot:gene17298-19029_t